MFRSSEIFPGSEVGTGANGSAELALPQGAAGGEELIAFVQNDNNGQIVAATEFGDSLNRPIFMG